MYLLGHLVKRQGDMPGHGVDAHLLALVEPQLNGTGNGGGFDLWSGAGKARQTGDAVHAQGIEGAVTERNIPGNTVHFAFIRRNVLNHHLAGDGVHVQFFQLELACGDESGDGVDLQLLQPIRQGAGEGHRPGRAACRR